VILHEFGTVRRGTLAVVLFLGLTVFGCNKNDNPVEGNRIGTLSEAQALQTQVEKSDSIAGFFASDAQILDDLDMRADDSGALGKVDNGATPVRWGRHIFWDRIVRTTETRLVGDSIAFVVTTRTVPAEMRIGIQFPNGIPGVIDSVIKKPFTLSVKRSVRFDRIARTADPDSNWRPAAISLVYGSSVPGDAKSFGITGMEITGKFGTTITNPLDTWFRYGRWIRSGIPQFSAGDSITVRVTLQSRSDSAEVVFLRHGFAGVLAERHRIRMRLASVVAVGGAITRTYERLLIASPLPRHILAARLTATVDAFSYNTLYENSGSVSNEFWGVPYVVTNY